jgi:hypothetical protein
MEVNGQLHSLADLLWRKPLARIGGWVFPRAGMDVLEKGQIFYFGPESNSGWSSP